MPIRLARITIHPWTGEMSRDGWNLGLMEPLQDPSRNNIQVRERAALGGRLGREAVNQESEKNDNSQ